MDFIKGGKKLMKVLRDGLKSVVDACCKQQSAPKNEY